MNQQDSKSRLKVLIIFVCVLLVLILIRTAYLTVSKGSEFEEDAKRNFLIVNSIDAPRGRILDRELRPLAHNQLTWTVSVRPYRLKRNEIADTLAQTSELLSGEFEPFLDDIVNLKPRWKSFELARGLSLNEAAPLLERKDNLSGLILTAKYSRYYPFGRVDSHITGYTGSIPVERVKSFQDRGYNRYDKVGHLGIEQSYEILLRGITGKEIIKRDARGRRQDVWVEQSAQPGKDIILSIDQKLQDYIYELLDRRDGVIIVMNCNNGEILGMVSCPDYDPNRVLQSFRNKEDSFFNKTTQGLFPPGSTIKPLTGLALIRKGEDPNEKIICTGKMYLPSWDRPFVCNNPWGHGSETLASALQHSCNVYFYDAARKCGSKHLINMAEEFGLYERTGVDLKGEKKGSLGLKRSDSVIGDLLFAGIGQGKVVETPLQMLRFICAIANGSHLPTPHFYIGTLEGEGRNFIPPDEKTMRTWESRRINLDENERAIILNGMRWVVQKEGGTAYKSNFPPEWDVAGKSGSAETPRGDVDAWFVSFAPAWQPKWAVLVLLEGAGHGGEMASPIAKDIYSWLFNNMMD